METGGVDENHPVKGMGENDDLEGAQRTKRIRATLGKKESTRNVLLQLRALNRRRIHRASIVVLVCLPCGIVCFILSDFVFKNTFAFLKPLTYAFGFIVLAAYIALAYRNISFVILKRFCNK